MLNNQIIAALVWITMAVTLAILAIPRPAHGENSWDHTACESKPGPGRWGYRLIDDRRCWFALESDEPRGKYRSKWRLYWRDEPKPMTEPSKFDETFSKMPSPSEFDKRWKGE
jgi:hypothetical protein